MIFFNIFCKKYFLSMLNFRLSTIYLSKSNSNRLGILVIEVILEFA